MSFPVVPLDSIPAPGLAVVVQDWARAAVGEGVNGAVRSVEGRLQVDRRGRDVAVRGQLRANVELRCDRCGELLDMDLAPEVDCLYLSPRKEEELPPEDVGDVGEYDGVALDLARVVCECFALELPARLLCADLDPEADAGCAARYRARAGPSPTQPDPRLAALKGVKPAR